MASKSLLAELNELLGGDVTADPVKLTTDLTGDAAPANKKSGSNRASSVRVDQVDRFMEERGDFKVGQTYRGRRYRFERIHPVSDADRRVLDTAGFPRAGVVLIDGVGLLVDDVPRLLLAGSFLVLGYADVAVPTAVTSSRRKRGRARGDRSSWSSWSSGGRNGSAKGHNAKGG